MPKGKTPTRNRYNPLSVVRNSINSAYNITSNALRDARDLIMRQPETRAVQNAVSSPSAAYTPVNRNDRSLQDISNRTGISMPQLVNANGGIRTLPPAGSYVMLQPSQAANNSTAQFYSQYGQRPPTGPNSFTSGSGQANTGSGVYNNRPTGTNSFLSGSGQANTGAAQVQGYIRDAMNDPSKPDPAMVPNNALTGLGLTAQDMTSSGYILNKTTGVWYKKGSSSDPSTNKNNNRKAISDAEFLQGMRYYKGKYVKIGDLVRRGILDIRTGRVYDKPMKRNKKGKLVPKAPSRKQEAPAAPAAPPPPDNREGPQTVLDIHLGSG
jgi:hypothetical protein